MVPRLGLSYKKVKWVNESGRRGMAHTQNLKFLSYVLIYGDTMRDFWASTSGLNTHFKTRGCLQTLKP